MLHSISSDELTEWAAYAQIDPFGNVRGDWQAAVVASTIFNTQVKDKCKQLPIKEFMPEFGERSSASSDRMSATEIHARIEMMRGVKRG